MRKQPEFGKRPRFYKKPTEYEIESVGVTAAEIRARTRARIIGSRVLSVAVATTVGTAITVADSLSGVKLSVPDIIVNFGIPAAINTAAQLKTENQLRHMGEEIIRVLPEIGKPPTEENTL